MPPVNRLVTRGMGTSRGVPGRGGMITRGMGGIFRFVAQQAERAIRYGRSSAQRAVQGLEEVVVWAKLIRVNDKKPDEKVEGFVRIGIDRARHIAVNIMGSITSKVRNVWEDIKVTITRIK